MRKKILIVGFSLLFFGTVKLYAQQGFVASGGDATGSGGTASYSIGQIDYVTATGSNGTISQGLQQPFEILVTSVTNNPGINLSAIVYPNPTTNFLSLKIENSKLDNVSYQLYDELGQLLTEKRIDANETKIELVNYSSAIYFLKVISNNKELKSFKIIKKS